MYIFIYMVSPCLLNASEMPLSLTFYRIYSNEIVAILVFYF